MIKFLGTYLEPVSYLVYTVALYLQYRRNRSIQSKVLLIFYLTATLLMLYANWLLQFPEPENLNEWVYNVLWFLTAPVLSFYFLQILTEPAKRRSIIWITAIVSLLFMVNFSADWISGEPEKLYSISASATCLCITICCFLYYHKVLTNVSAGNILLNFDFWLVSGFLLTFLGGLFIVFTYLPLSIFVYENSTFDSRNLLTIVWSVFNILLFLSAAVTLMVSIWINLRER